MNITIGIDPGVSGGFAVLTSGGKVDAFRFTTMGDMRDSILEVTETAYPFQTACGVTVRAFIEKMTFRPGFRGRDALMRNFGQWEGLMLGLEIPTEHVAAGVWQRGVGVPVKKDEEYRDHKRRLKARAQELFPGQRVINATADALLVAEWGRRREEKT